MTSKNMPGGRLTIVPTPIGNLGDITQRAKDALESADAVYAEDTRVSSRLLAALGLKRPIIRLDEQMMEKRAEEVVGRVLAGERICYCTDAGMPGVSDPGLRLVAAARDAGIEPEVLPGPSAVTLAYVASGTRNPHFYFGGFLPRKATELQRFLEGLRSLDAALIFYESPKRLLAALRVIADVFPHRELAVCRELTKLHEEVVRDRAGDVFRIFSDRAAAVPIKGEIVIVIDGPTKQEYEDEASHAQASAEEMARALTAQGMRAKEVAAQLSDALGIPKNKAYEIALNIR